MHELMKTPFLGSARTGAKADRKEVPYCKMAALCEALQFTPTIGAATCSKYAEWLCGDGLLQHREGPGAHWLEDWLMLRGHMQSTSRMHPSCHISNLEFKRKNGVRKNDCMYGDMMHFHFSVGWVPIHSALSAPPGDAVMFCMILT
jgi:hypothetical protein